LPDESLILEDNALAQIVFGENDRNLRKLEQQIGVRIRLWEPRAGEQPRARARSRGA
jgi:hypothetical protein